MKILLLDTKPLIWRRVQVESSMTFYALHHTIQLAMGWKNSHLFEFITEDGTVGLADTFSLDWDSDENIDAKKTEIGSSFDEFGQSCSYVYDLGDHWEHWVLTEAILPKEEGVVYPICTGGELCCPPEDCGGVWGYYELLKTVANKEHPDHQSMVKWLGKYDPSYFNIDDVNKKLQGLKTYIKSYERKRG